MSVNQISSNTSSLASTNKPDQSIEANRQTIKDVAQNDFGSASRLANDTTQALRDVSKTVTDAGKFIDSASTLMKDLQHASSPADISKTLKDASKMISDAATMMDDLKSLSNNPTVSDALNHFSDGKQFLQAAAQLLNSANGSNPSSTTQKVADNIQSAGKAVSRGMVAAEREAGQVSKDATASNLSSAMMRSQILQQMQSLSQGMNQGMPRISRTDSSVSANDRPAALTKNTATTTAATDTAPTSSPSLKDRVNGFIDKTVDNVLYNKLNLKQSYQGGSSASGEISKSVGKGITVDDVKNYALTGASPYGTEGKTLAEGSFNKNFGDINKTVSGQFGTASVSGTTSIGARGRVFGDVDLQNRQAEIGAEGEVGAHATYNATYDSPHAHIAGEDVGVDAGVTADVFAGADAKGEIGISLKGNSPEVNIGGEAFAGARASIQGGAEATINGQQVAEIHGKAEGWAGVGAKADADIGFKDGKLTVDLGLGAALGIGGSVDWGFSVNVAAIGNSIKDGVKNVVSSAVSGVENMGKSIATTATNVAKSIGNTVSNAVSSVGNAVKDAGNSVKNFFKSIF